MNIVKRFKKFWNRIIIKFKKQSISVISASISADGSLIDIRYNITRPDKLKRDERVYLIDENTNSNLEVARATKNGMQRPKQNSSGMLLFSNKNNKVQHGSLITLVFGSMKIEHIRIN